LYIFEAWQTFPAGHICGQAPGGRPARNCLQQLQITLTLAKHFLAVAIAAGHWQQKIHWHLTGADWPQQQLEKE